MSEEDGETTGVVKRFLFVNRKAPYGTIYALEALEVVLISAAFDQDVSLAFLDDGVYQLLAANNPTGIGMKNFSNTYRALEDYDITKLYVERESLAERGVSEDAFIVPVTVVSRTEMGKIMAAQDVVLSF